MALLELFAGREEPLRVGEVAAAISIPQPSATMILRNLTDMGYLSYDAKTRRFGPTMRVMLLGNWIARRHPAADRLPDALAELHRASHGETVWMALQSGAALRYIAVIEAGRHDRLQVNFDHCDPLTCSAGGRALLSLLTPTETGAWIRRCNVELTEARFKVREQECLAAIRAARDSGFAETTGELLSGYGALAVAFAPPIGPLTPIALGVSGPTLRLRDRKPAIVETLLAIKARFGPATGTVS